MSKVNVNNERIGKRKEMGFGKEAEKANMRCTDESCEGRDGFLLKRGEKYRGWVARNWISSLRASSLHVPQIASQNKNYTSDLHTATETRSVIRVDGRSASNEPRSGEVARREGYPLREARRHIEVNFFL